MKSSTCIPVAAIHQRRELGSGTEDARVPQWPGLWPPAAYSRTARGPSTPWGPVEVTRGWRSSVSRRLARSTRPRASPSLLEARLPKQQWRHVESVEAFAGNGGSDDMGRRSSCARGAYAGCCVGIPAPAHIQVVFENRRTEHFQVCRPLGTQSSRKCLEHTLPLGKVLSTVASIRGMVRL